MDLKITLMGTLGSGKTRFISEAIADINSFSPRVQAIPISREKVKDGAEIYNNRFSLRAYGEMQWGISICDYDGSMLKANNNDSDDDRQMLENILYESDLWIILIDGEYFSDGSEADEKIIKRIKRDSVKIIQPHIVECADQHDVPPKLFFLVTKAAKIIGKVPQERVRNIVMQAYEGIFAEKFLSAIIMLSECSSTRAAGFTILFLLYTKCMENEKDIYINNLDMEREREIEGLQNAIWELERQHALMIWDKQRLEAYKERLNNVKKEVPYDKEQSIRCKSKIGLKYIGMSVQSLIDNNASLFINGLERPNQNWELPIRINKERMWFTVLVLCWNIFMLVKSGGIGYIVTAFIAFFLTYKLDERRSIRLGVSLSLQPDIPLKELLKTHVWMTVAFVFLFWRATSFKGFVWAALLMVGAYELDCWREKRQKMEFERNFFNFFYIKARERK